MSVAIAIIVGVLAFIVVVAIVAAIRKRPPAEPIEAPKPTKQVSPPSPAGKPWFSQNLGEPGFTVISISDGQVPQISPRAGTGTGKLGKPADGFIFVGVSENPTAICKLTGKPAGECTCDRHKGARRSS